jgi:hypothetical protein
VRALGAALRHNAFACGCVDWSQGARQKIHMQEKKYVELPSPAAENCAADIL